MRLPRAGRSAQYVNSDDARIIVPEHSAVGESQSNGNAERAVQQEEDQVRTIKSALASRIGAKIPSSHPLVRWMVEHSVDILNKYTVNISGISPYEELHGQKAFERRIDLGERVCYHIPKKARAKLDNRWQIGVYLGSCSNSNEVYVGVRNGNARKTRSVCRVVAEERWSRDAIQRVLATPSELRPVDDNEVGADDIEISENPHDYSARDADAPEPATADAPDDVDAEVFKRIRITKADCIKYGYTGGCPRCADLEFGKANSKKAHNEECRTRMYRRFEQEKDAKWIRVQSEHRRDSPAVVEPIRPSVDLDAADVEEQPASKKPRRAEQFDDEDLADNNYSDSELPDIIEDDDDDDEPIREPDAKRSRVNEDDSPMPDHLLPGMMRTSTI